MVLDNLEEDSDYSITLTANIGTIHLNSDVVTASTSTAGISLVNICKFYYITIYPRSSYWQSIKSQCKCR